MGQSFREQLAQSIALSQRVITKITGRKTHLPLLLQIYSKSLSVLWFYHLLA